MLNHFSEQSFPLEPETILRLSAPGDGAGPVTTRQWLREAHAQLAHLLPRSKGVCLLTEQLADEAGRPVDVFSHFGIQAERLASLRGNWDGITHTAQAAGVSDVDPQPPPPWPGLCDVKVPVTGGVEVAGRMGFAKRGGEVCEADCLVILPGLLGDNNVLRTRDLAVGLLACGYHVLALEFRGLGQNHASRPDIAYTFGMVETADLFAVDRWLRAQPKVRRAGLIGYCWGANHALIAAFYENAPADHPSVPPAMAKFIPRGDRRPFTAGVMAFSPVLSFESLIEHLKRPWSRFRHPTFAGLQNTIKLRMKRVGYAEPSGSLRRVVDEEFARSEVNYPGCVEDAITLLRMLPYRGIPAGDKLAPVRTPSLIVYAANDPLSPAQDMADLIATAANPLAAAIVLPGGGHIGFAPYASRYYFSLIVNFFDPVLGAAARSAPAAE